MNILHARTQDVLAATGVGATTYSWVLAATEIAQLIGALLGIIATGFAIWLYVIKVKNAKRGGDNADTNR